MPTVNGLTLTLADRVRETTQTTGTGSYSLDGAPTGKRTFVSGIGNGTRCLYTVELNAGWEVGIGTITSGAPSTLSRDQILASSNSNNAVNWGSGIKDIFCDISAALANQIWTRPGAGLPTAVIEQRGPFTPTGSQSIIDITGIAATASVIHVGWSNLLRTDNSELAMQIGDSGGVENTAYAGTLHGSDNGGGTNYSTASSYWPISTAGGTTPIQHFGVATLIKINTTFWTMVSSDTKIATGSSASNSTSGAKAVSSTLDRIRIATAGAVNFGAQGTITAQIIHAFS